VQKKGTETFAARDGPRSGKKKKGSHNRVDGKIPSDTRNHQRTRQQKKGSTTGKGGMNLLRHEGSTKRV